MTKFLTLKHWQLFVLLIGIPIISEFVVIGSIVTSRDATIMAYYFPIMMIYFIGVFFGWFYTLGISLHKKLPESAPMNVNRFKIFLFIPVAYILLICAFMASRFSGISTSEQFNPAIFGLIIVPLHLFSMFCIFYCLYFNAKALKTVELQRPLTFSDYAGEFFLIWFFPIGVWIIQPRINKLFDPVLSNDAV
ncbi:MAG: hypothetical protein QM802_23255 [Agriterribacter sp.]